MVSLCLMTEKGFNVLQAIISNNLSHFIDFICIGQDKNIQNDFAQELSSLCKENKIKFSFNSDANSIKYIDQSLYSIAVSWRWMISLKHAKLLVLHDSLLPKYRGFAPLVNALKNGEKYIGVTAIEANDEYDKGKIIMQKAIPVNYPIKIQKAIEQVGRLYAEIVIEILNNLSKDELKTISQDESKATYSLWLDEEDYFVDWNKSSEEIKRFVDATGYPYNGAKCVVSGNILRIDDVELKPDVYIENRTPGKLIFLDKDCPVVICGKGLLKITNAYYIENLNSIIPFKKFRVRFK